ncbi:FliI/YscN family ATPase (plasmid) [Paroceanicella profunda]|uniref:FliI/YscN family ATPase n=1 Tax=Paroceanicella profunda TaxID=2579971 RepID=A0A5B8G0X1_9RHOB|nr:FliI/YscN family ATPase [Paroceanicella profunda]QDL94776.1 FliI/YscN family ATPase [Paroceanicella profunda]
MFETLEDSLSRITPHRRAGSVIAVDTGSLQVTGVQGFAGLGDRVAIDCASSGTAGAPSRVPGEIVALSAQGARVMTYGPTDGLTLGARVWLEPDLPVLPGPGWAGRVVDAFGMPLDGRPLPQGPAPVRLRREAPPANERRLLGPRLRTGLAALDTMLPLARGQRIGVFAGSGIGKSSLLADLARGVEADRVVVVLIGERGRELREFIEHTLGPEGMARAVVVVATSDQSPLIKRRAAWMGMAVAEAFRDAGEHVLLLVDSLTRFAEAHREVALTSGEPPSLRAYPPSTAALIAGLAERAGPGLARAGQGDITGVFTVLVAGSDMEEPVADITRGILDGHVILDREIAERGRFPAIDIRRSVSRALPGVASGPENALLSRARRLLGIYEQALPMIQTGLYAAGSDAQIDEAIRLHQGLDALFARRSASVEDSFAGLAEALGAPPPGRKPA